MDNKQIVKLAIDAPQERYTPDQKIERFKLAVYIDGKDQFREFVLASDHDALCELWAELEMGIELDEVTVKNEASS